MCTLILFSESLTSNQLELNDVVLLQTVPGSLKNQSPLDYEHEDMLVTFKNEDALHQAREVTGWLDVNGFDKTLLMPYVVKNGFMVCTDRQHAHFCSEWKLVCSDLS